MTPVLIGPRTQEQLDSLLFRGDLTLGDDLLDRIHDIGPPGTDLSAAGNYADEPPSLTDKQLRRR